MKTESYTENTPVTMTELAAAMRVSLKTISRHIHAEGYRPEFGRLTTIAHYKNWLRTVLEPEVHARRQAAKRARAQKISQYS